MKNEVPKPVIFGAIAVVALAVAFVGFRAVSGPPEFPEPKRLPNYTEGVPNYVKQAQAGERPTGMGDTSKLTPEQQAQIDASRNAAGVR